MPALPAGAGTAAESRASGTKPNVLFLAVDDLLVSPGCCGDPLARSPQIDRLAGEARMFTRSHTMQAVCGPARTAVMTGRLPDQTRGWHNRNLFRDTHPDTVTLLQHFTQHGYHAQGLGKTFSGDEREEDPASWSVPASLRDALRTKMDQVLRERAIVAPPRTPAEGEAAPRKKKKRQG